MSIHTVFEKYHHLDHLLSDRDWLTTDDDGNTDIRMMILYESWQAIKDELNATPATRKIRASPLRSCDCCLWNFEGECNLVKDSGFHYDYDRYADDDDVHEFKPCKYRIEYFDFEEWYLRNYERVMQE